MSSVDEASASVRVTIGGSMYDLSNMTGRLRQKLIQEGKLAADSTIATQNMTGKAIAEKKESLKHVTDKLEKDAEDDLISKENTYKVGDVVVFRKYASQVLAVHPKKGVIVRLKEGRKSKWIHHTKVKPASIDEE